MARPSTLPAADFIDRFRVQDWTFVQAFQQQRTASGGGDTRYADRAPALWKATGIKTEIMSHAEAEGVMALINSRAGGIKTVLLYNKRLPFPASDPDGALLGSYQPKLNVITNRITASFSDFPPGYVIPLGTFFGIVFDTSRYYLGQFVEARAANPITGAVAAAEVWPPLPASISGALDVNLRKPCAKFRIEPGSAFPSLQGGLHSEISFAAEQTYSR